MKEFDVNVQLNNKASETDINDLVSTALEGGINYWCGSARIKKDADKNYVGVAPENREKVEFASDVISQGGTLVLRDVEDPKEVWELNLENMLKGIAQHCTKKGMSVAELMDNYDACDADCIIQYALFGELVFG
jgi:hypothetical protein